MLHWGDISEENVDVNWHSLLFLKTSCDTLDLKLNVKWNLSNIHTTYDPHEFNFHNNPRSCGPWEYNHGMSRPGPRRFILRATSHTSLEPWPWNHESPKEGVSKGRPDHLQNHAMWSQTLKCGVSHMWPGPHPHAILINFLKKLRRSSYMIKLNKSTVVSILECHSLPMVLC